MKNSLNVRRPEFDMQPLEARALFSAAAPSGMTPAEIYKAYGFNQAYLVKKHIHYAADGAGQTIAIIDAFNDPNIKSNLHTFDSKFGLSDYVNQKKGIKALRVAVPDGLPRDDAGWSLETSLDVEWAHAIAPRARIMLVEAKSDSINDLLSALNFARNTAGVSVISMSWGGQEFRYETAYDQYLTTPAGHLGGDGNPGGITFISSAGDSGSGTSWPAASPNVIAVGGTTLDVSSSGTWLNETAWDGSGGGVSYIERTAAPDVAYDADPNTGFSVYDSVAGSDTIGWQTVGGTSAGSPQWAGIMAIADEDRDIHGRASMDETQALNNIYSLPTSDFHDITQGSNGAFQATVGTDLVTGRGSPIASVLIGQLGTMADV